MTCSRPHPLPPPREKRRERMLLLGVVLMVVLALAGPALVQPAHYHDFADQRAWGWLPHAMDVLSNLPFALGGGAGLWALARAVRQHAIDRASAGLAGLFFAGLLVTAGVSAYYHWQPDNAGLVWDRAGMVLAFGGLLGLAALQGVSQRAGVALAAAVLVLGLAAVQVWAVSGNLLPWVLLQLGGMGLILVLACLPSMPSASGLRLRWTLVILWYALAKVMELADHPVFELTGQLISGHSLKHVLASCAAWPVVLAAMDAVRMSSGRAENQGRIPFTFQRLRQPPPGVSTQQTNKRSQA